MRLLIGSNAFNLRQHSFSLAVQAGARVSSGHEIGVIFVAETSESEFARFLLKGEPTDENLPLLHTTNAFSFKSIYESDGIQSEECKVFNEPLTYLFYGRPAYRTATGQIGFAAKFSWPVVFVFHPEKLPKPKRVFPFDTGAFAKGLYSEFFDRRQKLAAFDVGSDIEMAARCVAAFYRNNHEYFINKSTKNPEIEEEDFYVNGVDSLLRSNQIWNGAIQNPRDERATSIEVQLEQGIDLETCPPQALILPQSYVKVKSVQERIEAWNCRDVHYYETHNMQNYEFWHGQIYAKLSDIYKSLGLIYGNS